MITVGRVEPYSAKNLLMIDGVPAKHFLRLGENSHTQPPPSQESLPFPFPAGMRLPRMPLITVTCGGISRLSNACFRHARRPVLIKDALDNPDL